MWNFTPCAKQDTEKVIFTCIEIDRNNRENSLKIRNTTYKIDKEDWTGHDIFRKVKEKGREREKKKGLIRDDTKDTKM